MVEKAAVKIKAPKRMKPADVGPFLTAISGGNADPSTELHYTSPFMLLVAVVLSAQATDVGVNRVLKPLIAVAPTPAAMAELGEKGIRPLIRSIGLWQAKAKNIAGLSRQLIELHGGEVPGDREKLEALPGVGRKTANVVLSEIFGQPTMAVDTHIFRLGNRTGIAPGSTPRVVEDGLLQRVPKSMLKPAHLWLILHGRYICKARTPECWRCPGVPYCVFKPKTLAPNPARNRKDSAKKRPVG